MKRSGLEISMLRSKRWWERAVNIKLVAVNTLVAVDELVVDMPWHVMADGATVCDISD